MKYKCPCCGELTYETMPGGTYEICPVCKWEDDPVQFKDPDYAGGANECSLNQAIKNWESEDHPYKTIRVDWAKSDADRDAEKSTPDDIERFDDILYGEDEVWQILDVYRPKNSDGSLPVIINVHGGAWVYGNKDIYQYYCMSLAKEGYAVVNFSYRLAPENKFPTMLEDINAVINWMFVNSNKYGFDMNNVYGVGDSAGAHLLALYCCFITNFELEQKFDFEKPESFSMNAVALNCGAYDFLTFKDGELELDKFAKYAMPQGGSKEDIDLFTVKNYLSIDFPPAFVMTASHDFLKEQAPTFVTELKKYDIEYKYVLYEIEGEELSHIFHVDIANENAIKCNKDECEFFNQYKK